MLQISRSFCEQEIRASDADQEVVCENCGRRFPVESGDACYFKDGNPSFALIKKD